MSTKKSANKAQLNEVERKFACIHEAAHAAVLNLAGLFLVSVEVAPVGSTVKSWYAEGVVGQTVISEWGVTRFEAAPVNGLYIRHDSKRGSYAGQKDAWNDYLTGLEEFRKTHPSSPSGAVHNQVVKGMICGYLAGPVAEAAARGLESSACLGADEFAYVLGLMDLQEDTSAGHSSALQKYLDETQRVLAEPEVSAAIEKLAATLETKPILEHDELMDIVPPYRPEWHKA